MAHCRRMVQVGQAPTPLLIPRNAIRVRAAAEQAVPASYLLTLKHLLCSFYFLVTSAKERGIYFVPLWSSLSPVQKAEPWGQVHSSSSAGHGEALAPTEVTQGKHSRTPMFCSQLCHPAAVQQDERLLPFTPPSPAEQTDEPGLIHSHR